MANSTKNKQQGEMMRFMFGESKEKKWEVYIHCLFVFVFWRQNSVCLRRNM